tara:strand:+ start:5510 stop:5989 length:480 start_codon:yes stop_codon:yes gene_type:complete
VSPDHTLFGLGNINGLQYNIAAFEREHMGVAVAIVAPGDKVYRRIVNKRVAKLLQRPRWQDDVVVKHGHELTSLARRLKCDLVAAVTDASAARIAPFNCISSGHVAGHEGVCGIGKGGEEGTKASAALLKSDSVHHTHFERVVADGVYNAHHLSYWLCS